MLSLYFPRSINFEVTIYDILYFLDLIDLQISRLICSSLKPGTPEMNFAKACEDSQQVSSVINMGDILCFCISNKGSERSQRQRKALLFININFN